MIKYITQWALNNRILVLAGSSLLLLWGGYVSYRMPVDIFPDLTAPTVTVITEAYGMAPDEVESLISFPIETVLNGAPGVRRVRSSIAAGLSMVWVDFDWGIDIYSARQVVVEKLRLVSQDLPPESGQPTIAPIVSIMGEIMFLALTSETHSPMELRTLADWILRRRLLAIPGVAQVSIMGGDEKQYQVLVDPSRLAFYEISFHELSQALEQSNRNALAGFVISGPQQYMVRGLGRIRNLQDIEQTVVAMRGGQPVLVKHISEVKIGPAPKLGEGSFNTNPAVIIGIQRHPDANTLELTQRLDSALDEIQKTLPKGMVIQRDIFRQADFIHIAINNLMHSLWIGAILVVITLALFLTNLKATFITVVAIPLSLIAAVLSLRAIGANINTMTLGGLAIAIGLLEDGAITGVENVFRRMRQNASYESDRRRSVLSVILDATYEIQSPVVFATFIIILVFMPLFFLSGVEGRLMQPLGFAFVAAIFASLLVSLIITPVLCYFFLARSGSLKKDRESWLVRKLKAVYKPILMFFIDHPKLVAGVSGVLTIAAVVSGLFLGRGFLPEFNEGSLSIKAVTLPGTSLDLSNKLGMRVEEVLLSHPEVRAVARRTGRAKLDEHAMGVEASEIDVTIDLKGRNLNEFLSDLRRSFAVIPGMNIVIDQPISHRIDHMLAGVRADLAIKIFGDDLHNLRYLAETVRQTVSEIPGAVDLFVEQQLEIPVLNVRFDRQAMARFGLTVEDATYVLEGVTLGHEVTKVFEGQGAFDLVVKYKGGHNTDIETLGRTLVDVPGGRVPLKMLADIRIDQGQNMINREKVQRRMVVMANISGRAIGDVVKDVENAIRERVILPEGYYIEYGGQFEAEREATRRLTLLTFAVVVGIGLILGTAFRSFKDTLFIMLNLPLSLIGGVAGVYLSGGMLSVASLIGFIGLFGIATRNGITLISHIQHLIREEGVTDFKEAVVRGSMERLSPILMTALTTALALIPLALGAGQPGNEIQSPMAMVILCGLTTSTFLNMLVVPVLYHKISKKHS
jgi:CzcA family heavy metal efflux pump